MKESCLLAVPDDSLIVIRQWQIEFCKGNTTAAALLSFFSYWHDIKLEIQKKNVAQNAVAVEHGDEPAQDTSLWQFHTEKELESGIKIAKRDSIRKAIEFLEKRGVLIVSGNPNERYKFDRTRYFLLNTKKLNKWLKAYINRLSKIQQSKSKNPSRSSENQPPSPKNQATIPEIPTVIPFNERENAPEADAPAPQENESDNQTGESPYKLPEYSEQSLPRAVQIYFETFPTTALDGDRLKQFCEKMMTVNETVWRKTLDDWKLNGYKSGNVAGMINRYEKDLESQKPSVTNSGWMHEPGKDKARGWMH